MIFPDQWRLLYSINPLVGVIDGFRWCLLGGESQLYLPGLALSVGVSTFFVFLGIRTFRKIERSFADLVWLAIPMSGVPSAIENLSKRYLVGHRSARREKYTALRDVISREVRNLARKTVAVFRARQIVQGDEIEEFWALRDVSLEVKQGEVLGMWEEMVPANPPYWKSWAGSQSRTAMKNTFNNSRLGRSE
jgi:hypothetical protein